MNKQRGLFQKGVTVSVIVLFLSLGFTPLIYAVEETKEVTLTVPSIFGIKKQKMRLTSEQSNKLDSIFDDLQAQLYTMESVEDTKVLFKRIIDSLVRNDLLSGFDAYFVKKLLSSSIVDRFYSALNEIFNIKTDIENSNCWTAGETTGSYFLRPITHFIGKISSGSWFAIPFLRFSPIVFFSDISFGYRTEIDHWTYNIWSKGWIRTDNIYGNKSVIGTFRGGLSKIDLIGFSSFDSTYYIGVYFFLGIGFYKLDADESIYFLGRAASVDIYEK